MAYIIMAYIVMASIVMAYIVMARYDPAVNPGVYNFFSTVAYRYGHSEVGGIALAVDDEGLEVPEGHQMLHTHFFAPARALRGGIEPVLRGMAQRMQHEVDPHLDPAIQP